MFWFAIFAELFVAHAGAVPLKAKPQLVQVARLVRSGQYGQAIRQSRRALELDPSSDGMRALLGIALERNGNSVRALPLLEASAGTRAYIELGGYGAHADAQRASGVGSPWTIRRQRLSGDLSDRQAVQTFTQGVDDLLAVGDVWGAIGLGERALERDPGASAAHAFLATALLVAGDTDGAEYHHWLSYRGGPRRLARTAVNEALLAEQAGDQVGAQRSWERLEVTRRGDPRVASWHAGWLRRQGQLQLAKARTFSVEQKGPLLLAERVRVLRLLNEHEAAAGELGTLETRFPMHPVLAELKNE